MQTFSESAAYVLRFINQTNKSIFLTGKAGTGKTTLLKEIIRTTHKNTVVVAPTGIAALNAGGVTIHSLFQLPFGGFIPDNKVIPHFSDHLKFETKSTLKRHFRLSAIKQAVIRNMELLIIDEVSMLRADLLDAIELMLQSVRKSTLPFGGVQVLYIGDLLQLPPVIKNEEWAVLKNYYQGKFFFHSYAVQNNPPIYIELSKIFRQTDDAFISILNNLRNNTITPDDVAGLNHFVNANFDFKQNKGYVTLTTHNAKADAINVDALADLNGRSHTYAAEITGEFPDKIFPVEQHLNLKEGAQVMFVKNDPSVEKNYFNGKTGTVKSLSEQEILVHFPEENKTIEVDRYEWKNIRYNVDELSKEIKEEVLGTYVHFPIKLAWAITIHKSQGLTFDKAVLDVSQVFLPGQAYVALSRLRSLNGLVLLSPMQMNGILNDGEVMSFALNKAEQNVLEDTLVLETRKFIQNYIRGSFDWKELAQEWRNHRFSYKTEAAKSEKGKHALWADKQFDAIEKLVEPGIRFITQIDRLFSADTFDIVYLEERINAAYSYFFPPMDVVLTELLWKIEMVMRLKKMKAFYEELTTIEELQIQAVLRLLKVRKLVETFALGKEICKENLISEDIKYYKIRKRETIKENFKATNTTLIADEADTDRYSVNKKSKSKLPKKSTVEETLELWRQNISPTDIAKTRKLTKQTIYNHLAKLIQSQTINIGEVLPQERIMELAEVFEGYTEDTLSGLKEKHGDRFSWDELRMYKASLQLSQ